MADLQLSGTSAKQTRKLPKNNDTLSAALSAPRPGRQSGDLVATGPCPIHALATKGVLRCLAHAVLSAPAQTGLRRSLAASLPLPRPTAVLVQPRSVRTNVEPRFAGMHTGRPQQTRGGRLITSGPVPTAVPMTCGTFSRSIGGTTARRVMARTSHRTTVK